MSSPSLRSRAKDKAAEYAHAADQAADQALDKASALREDALHNASYLSEEVYDTALAVIDQTKDNTKGFFSLDRFAGEPYSVQRLVTAFGLAFVVSTVVRIICISPHLPVFGPHLQKTLAPIENDDVSWNVIALTRIIDLILGTYVWGAAGRVEGPMVGLVLSLISRPALSQFFHHHFLLSSKTVTEVLLTDVCASAAALGVISSLLPRQPSFRPAPIPWIKRHANASDVQLILVAFALGALTNGLLSFLADRFALHEIMKAGVVDHLVPAYFAKVRPSSAFMLKHPLLPVPSLRSDFHPLNMAEAILHGTPFVLASSVLSLFVLPAKSSAHITTLVYLLCAPATFLTVWNLLPVTAWASAVVSFAIASRQAVVAGIISWVLTDLRRPVINKVFLGHTSRVVGSEIDGSKLLQDEVTTL